MSDRYLSKYSNGKNVSPAQYITELICENKAKKDKCDLHYRFWTSRKWSAFYRNQIASAHELLKRYDAEPIIRALRDIDGQKIFSLRAPHLPAIIDKHKELLANQNTEFTKEFNRESATSYRNTTNKKGIISKLKDLDNDT